MMPYQAVEHDRLSPIPAVCVSFTDEQMGILQEKISQLDSVVCDLERRLQPVMTDSVPPSPEGAKSDDSYLAPIPENIRFAHQRIAVLTDKLNELIGRLHI